MLMLYHYDHYIYLFIVFQILRKIHGTVHGSKIDYQQLSFLNISRSLYINKSVALSIVLKYHTSFGLDCSPLHVLASSALSQRWSKMWVNILRCLWKMETP